MQNLLFKKEEKAPIILNYLSTFFLCEHFFQIKRWPDNKIIILTIKFEKKDAIFFLLGFLDGSVVKNLPAKQEMLV